MKTALLLIDLQVDFLQPSGRKSVGDRRAASVIACAARLLNQAAQNGVPTAFVVNQFRPDDRIGNVLRRHAAIRGSKGAEIDPRIPPSAAPVFPKDRSNAFSNPMLDRHLRAQGTTHLLITGVMAEACVRATAVAAIKKGYAVTVVDEGVESTTTWLRSLGLGLMRRAGVQIRSCAEALSAMPTR